jgi:hypothetical protein
MYTYTFIHTHKRVYTYTCENTYSRKGDCVKVYSIIGIYCICMHVCMYEYIQNAFTNNSKFISINIKM